MNFDAVARHYSLLEHLAFGRYLERCRTALLPMLDAPRKALFIGEGDGRFLQRFAQAFPETEVDVIEASARMIQIAERRSNIRQVRFSRADVLTEPLDAAKYDLIVTHFFVDTLTDAQLHSLVERLRRAATSEAHWLISEFQICREPVWARYLSRCCIAVMYAFFRLTAGLKVSIIPDYEAAFTRAGMQRRTKVTSLGGFLTAELWRVRRPCKHEA
jgi:ubiquinone/menaquinone biosynthesis C-methylase UbiE